MVVFLNVQYIISIFHIMKYFIAIFQILESFVNKLLLETHVYAVI